MVYKDTLEQTAKKHRVKMGELIGNDIAAPEFKERIDTVVTRVNNADPNIKATLKSFYNIEDTDLVKYFLNPKENLPKLQEKVTAAEIGNEALKQNLITGVTSAENLAKLGITQKEAREGYSTISQILPTASKLGQIYSEEKLITLKQPQKKNALENLTLQDVSV